MRRFVAPAVAVLLLAMVPTLAMATTNIVQKEYVASGVAFRLGAGEARAVHALETPFTPTTAFSNVGVVARDDQSDRVGLGLCIQTSPPRCEYLAFDSVSLRIPASAPPAPAGTTVTAWVYTQAATNFPLAPPAMGSTGTLTLVWS